MKEKSGDTQLLDVREEIRTSATSDDVLKKKKNKADDLAFIGKDELVLLQNVFLKFATTIVYRGRSEISLSLQKCYYSPQKNAFIIFDPDDEETRLKPTVIFPSNIQFIKVGYSRPTTINL